MVVERLKRGEKAVGTMVRLLRNPAIAWMVKQAGLDFYMYDMEHGPYAIETLADAFQLARALGIGGFVRVPELARSYVSRVLDAGATGVMVPMLESVEQAAKFVEWAKFAPTGKRGFGSLGGHTDYSGVGAGVEEFMDRANRQTLTIAQIETAAGIDHVDQIAATEGIDALLIGPNDLALSLGAGGDLLGDTVDQAIRRAAAAARKHHKVFGIHGPDALLERWIAQGCNLVMSGLDGSILAAGLKSIAAKYR